MSNPPPIHKIRIPKELSPRTDHFLLKSGQNPQQILKDDEAGKLSMAVLRRITPSKPRKPRTKSLSPRVSLTQSVSSVSESIPTQAKNKLLHLAHQPVCTCPQQDQIYNALSTQENSEKLDTIIPEQFHDIKIEPMRPLEFADNPCKTRYQNHKWHTTVFPSLWPTTREEVIKLGNTMQEMLKSKNIAEDAILPTVDQVIEGSRMLYDMAESIEEEQHIYNVCLHEIVRQVTVNCLERGSLLAKIRERYAALIRLAPHQLRIAQEAINQCREERDVAQKRESILQEQCLLLEQELLVHKERICDIQKQYEQLEYKKNALQVAYEFHTKKVQDEAQDEVKDEVHEAQDADLSKSKTKAALVVQKSYRQYAWKKKSKAATQLQRFIRKCAKRKKMQAQVEHRGRMNAAICIQSSVRGWLTRKHVNILKSRPSTSEANSTRDWEEYLVQRLKHVVRTMSNIDQLVGLDKNKMRKKPPSRVSSRNTESSLISKGDTDELIELLSIIESNSDVIVDKITSMYQTIEEYRLVVDELSSKAPEYIEQELKESQEEDTEQIDHCDRERSHDEMQNLSMEKQNNTDMDADELIESYANDEWTTGVVSPSPTDLFQDAELPQNIDFSGSRIFELLDALRQFVHQDPVDEHSLGSQREKENHSRHQSAHVSLLRSLRVPRGIRKESHSRSRKGLDNKTCLSTLTKFARSTITAFASQNAGYARESTHVHVLLDANETDRESVMIERKEAILDPQGNPLSFKRFPDFVYAEIARQFGLPKLVLQKMSEILNSVVHYRTKNDEIHLFAKMLEESLSCEQSLFIARLKLIVVRASQGHFWPNRSDPSLYEYIDCERAIKVTQMMTDPSISIALGIQPWDPEKLPDILKSIQMLTHLANTESGPSISQVNFTPRNGTSRNRLSGAEAWIPVHIFLEIMLEEQCNQMSWHEQQQWLLHAFERVDSNHDGWISQQEFIAALSQVEPIKSHRELSMMYRNLTLSTQTTELSLSFFTRAIGQLFMDYRNRGLVLPPLPKSERLQKNWNELELERDALLNVLTKHWSRFQSRISNMIEWLSFQGNNADRRHASLLSVKKRDLEHNIRNAQVERAYSCLRSLLLASSAYFNDRIMQSKARNVPEMDNASCLSSLDKIVDRSTHHPSLVISWLCAEKSIPNSELSSQHAIHAAISVVEHHLTTLESFFLTTLEEHSREIGFIPITT